MPNIIPTVGRVVYYKARGSADGVFPKKDRAAIITDVQTDDAARDENDENVYQVRVCVLNPEGIFFSDWLDQGQEGGQWDWMPFQKGQAQKTDELEKRLGQLGQAEDITKITS